MVLLVPALVFAGTNSFGVAKTASQNQNGGVVVELVVSNAHPLAGLDIPLRYSEGVTLEKVTFEGTRVSYFDFKSAYINHEERTVLIGLLPQLSPVEKPDLPVGEGTICQLHFRVDDESVSKVTIEAIVTKDPYHRLSYIYMNDRIPETLSPEFNSVSVSLSGPGELPQEYALHQNFPNPFNPTTTIAFSLPNAGNVNLSVFNVLGQKVATLKNGEMEAGNHTITWDASQQASGVYFYRLEANDYSKTIKAMLLK
jgi:hypothetical protein